MTLPSAHEVNGFAALDVIVFNDGSSEARFRIEAHKSCIAVKSIGSASNGVVQEPSANPSARLAGPQSTKLAIDKSVASHNSLPFGDCKEVGALGEGFDCEFMSVVLQCWMGEARWFVSAPEFVGSLGADDASRRSASGHVN
jgi:hypothetical protein